MSTDQLLPPGWTVHTAPSGHLYYYHKESNKSTYTRPEFFESHVEPPKPVELESRTNVQKPKEKADRPRFKKPIPLADPWLLVTTKKGRTFVHNPKTLVSLWDIPKDIQPAVDALRIEERKQDRRDRGLPSEDEEEGIGRELTETDMAFQLAEMAQEDEQIYGYSYEPTLEERIASFKTTKNRKSVYEAWCRERSLEIYAEKASKDKGNPVLDYNKLLVDHANLKVFWHEFRRKFKKDPAFINYGDNDKQREKQFREFQSRMKLAKQQRENDFRKLLIKNKSRITSANVPEDIMSDLCFVTIDSETRDEILRAFTEDCPAKHHGEVEKEQVK